MRIRSFVMTVSAVVAIAFFGIEFAQGYHIGRPAPKLGDSCWPRT